MKSRLRKFIAAISSVTLLLGVVLVADAWHNRDWFEIFIPHPASVFEDGKQVTDVHVFRSAKGIVLIRFSTDHSTPFLYIPGDQEVLQCNTGTFLDLGAFGIQKRDMDGYYPCAGAGKQEIEQNVKTTENSLAFSHWGYYRIHPYDRTETQVVRRLEVRW